MSILDLFLQLGTLSPLRYEAVKCGHRSKRCGRVSAFSYDLMTKMPKNDKGSIDYCLDCIGKMAIRCAWCSNPIFIGQPVTLYTPPSDFQIPAHAIVYSQDPLRLVGCLGWDCADTGAARAGFWLPGENGKGRVQRIQTAYDALLKSEEPSIAIVDDLSNIKESPDSTLILLESQKVD